MAVQIYTDPTPQTVKDKLDVYASKKLPDIAAKSVDLSLRGFVTVFRFLVSLLKDAFNR